MTVENPLKEGKSKNQNFATAFRSITQQGPPRDWRSFHVSLVSPLCLSAMNEAVVYQMFVLHAFQSKRDDDEVHVPRKRSNPGKHKYQLLNRR